MVIGTRPGPIIENFSVEHLDLEIDEKTNDLSNDTLRYYRPSVKLSLVLEPPKVRL